MMRPTERAYRLAAWLFVVMFFAAYIAFGDVVFAVAR